jgi:hypothetical protein
MYRRPVPRIVVQRGYAENDVRLGGPLRHEMGTAGGAEPADLARRGLVGRKPVFAPQPAKMRTLDPCGGGEGAGVRLAARSAMAMHDFAVELRYLVGDRAAQALSPQMALYPQRRFSTSSL